MTTRETIYHCSGPSCCSSQQSMARPPIHGWIEIREGVDRETIYDFCSWDCVMKFAAKVDPVEVLP